MLPFQTLGSICAAESLRVLSLYNELCSKRCDASDLLMSHNFRNMTNLIEINGIICLSKVIHVLWGSSELKPSRGSLADTKEP